MPSFVGRPAESLWPAASPDDVLSGSYSSEASSLVVLVVELAILGAVLLIDLTVFRWASRAPARISDERMIIVEKVFGFLISSAGHPRERVTAPLHQSS